jgi:peptidoglycan/xylan/chitin deacetylase (PgdA/CDA1 family)
MKGFVLTYHSHHVVGIDYAANDHVAFPIDLRTITRCGFRIVSLRRLVDRFGAYRQHQTSDDERYVALTFDDGPVFDIDDFQHPVYGDQLSFKNAMVRFLENEGGARQPELHATSFVIASAHARRVMESNADPQYTFLTRDSLDESWWNRAIETGLIGIANHSWDHLHPALAQVRHSRQARADFTQVDNEGDADAQIEEASEYIFARTRGKSSPYFAYPFGQSNTFLERDYLPRRGDKMGVEAAFTTKPIAIAKTDSIWALPRLTCGHHWRAADALAAILDA